MHNDHFNKVPALYTLDFDASYAIEVEPLGKVIDIWGDGSFWAISTPGHTDGHISYLVNANDGWILLTGDASHTRWGFENGVAPGWAEDRKMATKSLAALRKFSAQNRDVRVIFGHEG